MSPWRKTHFNTLTNTRGQKSIKIIPQYPNHTMVIDDGEGDRDIRTWEKIIELCSNGLCDGQRNDFKPTSVQTQLQRNDLKPTLCFDFMK